MPSPQIILGWSIANSGTDIGSTRSQMRDGWPTFIDDYVAPGIAWARATGVEPAVVIQHPWGLYSTQADDAMHFDGYDYAVAAGATWLTNNFATAAAWKPITSDVQCYAYLGGCHLTDRLRDLPPAEFRTMVLRNLKPLKSAGFRGVIIDYAENAITGAFTHPTVSAQSMTRSVDSVLLEICDQMFTAETGVEAAPRNFAPFAPLWGRTCFAQDSVWRHRYGGFSAEQIAEYGYGTRHSEHVALGYDRSVLTGNVWRTLDYADDPTDTLALAKLIVDEGDLPAFNPLPFILNNILASEVVA
jgi:hypothetical protein